jgi:LCP family protein required for cell wall assembly
VPTDEDRPREGDHPRDHPGDNGPGRQFFVPAPGGTPDPPPSSPPPALRPPPAVPPPPREPERPPPSRPADPPPTASPRRGAPRPATPAAGGRPPKPPGPPKSPAAPAGGGRGRFRPKKRWFLVYLPLLVVALLGFFGLQAFRSYRTIERVDLSAVLDPVSGDTVNYLLVGSDSRSGLDPDVPVGGKTSVTGKRSDTIILLRVTPKGSMMMSIPRDLWVTIANTNKKGRINGAYNAGPANLVSTVKANLNVPVNHYMEVGFESFVGVVDALGGVTINVPHPAFDRKSGLKIDQAGDVTLDGRQALAYARSRTYTEIIDGKAVTDPTADLGREKRQQQFLRTALADVGNSKNPIALLGVTDALSKGLIIDDSLGLFDLAGLARKLGASSPQTVELPTKPASKSGAAVLVLAEPQAQAVLARFR